MKWQALATAPSQLGESPYWHPQEQMLYWVDIPSRQIHRANIFTSELQSWAMPQEPGCIAPAQGGGLVVALRDGMYRAREWGGALELLHRFGHDTSHMRFNDGKCDPLGRFWAGTMNERRDSRGAALYSLDARGGGAPVVRTQVDDAMLANGLAWSPDGKTVYWADTVDHNIRTWRCDAEGNVSGAPHLLRQFPPKPDGWEPGMPGYGGRPDGAAMDTLGKHCAAMYEGARLLKFSPAGELLEEIPMPVECPTMPCFGGDDMCTLYVTSARIRRPEAELQAKPQSGCVFFARVDVPGLPVNFFQG